MDLNALYLQIKGKLSNISSSQAGFEAENLLYEVLALQKTDFITQKTLQVPKKERETIFSYVERRLNGEPLYRILGKREFWGLEFKVTPDTLDPRPDTETLVEAVLAYVNTRTTAHSCEAMNPEGGEGEGLRILDLGTGTGCILISLLRELPKAQGFAVDYSFAAAKVARENALNNGVADRFHIIQGDWMVALKPQIFDIIVSNPPYIIESDIENLSVEVKNHDPILALSGGEDGYDAYKKIISALKIHLNPQSRAFLEIGQNQLSDITRLVDDSKLSLCDSKADITGIPRVVEICRGDK